MKFAPAANIAFSTWPVISNIVIDVFEELLTNFLEDWTECIKQETLEFNAGRSYSFTDVCRIKVYSILMLITAFCIR